jgi:hypothetical protein
MINVIELFDLDEVGPISFSVFLSTDLYLAGHSGLELSLVILAFLLLFGKGNQATEK